MIRTFGGTKRDTWLWGRETDPWKQGNRREEVEMGEEGAKLHSLKGKEKKRPTDKEREDN